MDTHPHCSYWKWLFMGCVNPDERCAVSANAGFAPGFWLLITQPLVSCFQRAQMVLTGNSSSDTPCLASYSIPSVTVSDTQKLLGAPRGLCRAMTKNSPLTELCLCQGAVNWQNTEAARNAGSEPSGWDCQKEEHHAWNKLILWEFRWESLQQNRSPFSCFLIKGFLCTELKVRDC